MWKQQAVVAGVWEAQPLRQPVGGLTPLGCLTSIVEDLGHKNNTSMHSRRLRGSFHILQTRRPMRAMANLSSPFILEAEKTAERQTQSNSIKAPFCLRRNPQFVSHSNVSFCVSASHSSRASTGQQGGHSSSFHSCSVHSPKTFIMSVHPYVLNFTSYDPRTPSPSMSTCPLRPLLDPHQHA